MKRVGVLKKAFSLGEMQYLFSTLGGNVAPELTRRPQNKLFYSTGNLFLCMTPVIKF